jgi:hypothetical protein
MKECGCTVGPDKKEEEEVSVPWMGQAAPAHAMWK